MKKIVSVQTALQKAVSMLARRPLSAAEVRGKLQEQGYEQVEIETSLAYLEQRRYLNDAELCAMLLRKFAKCNTMSKKAIIFKLKQRGLQSSLIQEMMAEYNETEEWQQALQALTKRERQNRKQECSADKMCRYLATRGFPAAAAIQAVRYYLDTVAKNLYNCND